MSVFNLLGDAINLPKKDSNLNDAITSFTDQNFNLPSINQKAAELGDRLSSTGMTSMFDQPLVNYSIIDPETQAALDQLFLQEQQNQDALNQLSASQTPATTSDRTLDLKVMIKQEPAIGTGPNQIVFTVMPRIDENGTVEYESVMPVQHPGGILKYKSSSARTWTVSGRLISRTSAEATLNLKLINMIRAWRMPFHGEGTASSVAPLLGAPPVILTLSAYGPRMIGPSKCVLKSYNWTFDNTLDYVDTFEGNPFPVILDVSLSLEEAWSPSEYSGFDIVKYKNGELGPNGAFKRVTTNSPSRPRTQAAGGTGAQVNQPQTQQNTTPSNSVLNLPTVDSTYSGDGNVEDLSLG